MGTNPWLMDTAHTVLKIAGVLAWGAVCGTIAYREPYVGFVALLVTGPYVL